jgi:uncharacterized metal-binding protein YceD (DUF177 family)
VVARVFANHDTGELALTEPRAMPEFSRLVHVDALAGDGRAIVLRADEGECAALAGRLDLLAIGDLVAEVSPRRTAAGLVRLNVNFSANVVQSCVVSLEAVAEKVADRFSVLVEGGRAGAKPDDAETEVYVDPFGDDPVEVLVDGQLDVGELVAQHLSLSLDPYPRAPVMDGQATIAEAGGQQAGTADEEGAAAIQGGDRQSVQHGVQHGGQHGMQRGVRGDADFKRENPFAALKQWRPGGQDEGAA